MGIRSGARLIVRWGLAWSVVALMMLHAPGVMANVSVLYDDLLDSDVGQVPALWEVTAAPGIIEVVADTTTIAGKAIRFSADPDRANTGMTLRPHPDAISNGLIVGIDHAVHWERGRTNIYFENIPSGSARGHNAHWYVGNGEVGYVYTENDQTQSVEVQQLEDGWNQVRIVMHVEANEAFLFVNNMEEPAAGPLPLRVPFATLDNVQIRLNAAGTITPLAQSYFGDFHIWMIESQ